MGREGKEKRWWITERGNNGRNEHQICKNEEKLKQKNNIKRRKKNNNDLLIIPKGRRIASRQAIRKKEEMSDIKQ